jgi:hypothetical protein
MVPKTSPVYVVYKTLTLNRKTLIVSLQAHACNASYSGGRNQEDCGSKPPQANSLRDPTSKKPFTRKGLVEWFKV